MVTSTQPCLGGLFATPLRRRGAAGVARTQGRAARRELHRGWFGVGAPAPIQFALRVPVSTRRPRGRRADTSTRGATRTASGLALVLARRSIGRHDASCVWPRQQQWAAGRSNGSRNGSTDPQTRSTHRAQTRSAHAAHTQHRDTQATHTPNTQHTPGRNTPRAHSTHHAQTAVTARESGKRPSKTNCKKMMFKRFL